MKSAVSTGSQVPPSAKKPFADWAVYIVGEAGLDCHYCFQQKIKETHKMAGARKTVKPKFNYFTASVRRGWLNKS